MRARTALGLALLLALPLVLAAAPQDEGPLASHAAGARLGGQIELVLGRVAREAPPLRPGVMPAAPPLPASPPLEGGGPAVEVHLLAGERAWTQWVPVVSPQAVDLDGDGAPELRISVDQVRNPALRVEGQGPARVAWAAWIEDGAARYGLTGAGRAPPRAEVSLREGELRLDAAGPAAAWHAAFAFAGEHKRTLAWLGERGADLDAALGQGYIVKFPRGAAAVRLLLADDARTHDLTLRDAPPGAVVAREADGPLRYRAPRAGGSLAYAGDADAAGQRGDLSLAVERLPRNLTLAPDGEGFVLDAGEPTDLILTWSPPGGKGIRIVGDDVTRVTVQPGAAGGLVVAGPTGRLAVGAADEEPSDLGTVVDLGAQGAAAVDTPAFLTPAAAALALAGMALWVYQAFRPRP